MPLTETPFYTLLPSVPDTQSMYLAVIYNNTVSVLRSRICITGKSWIRIRFKIIRIIFLDLIPIIVKFVHHLSLIVIGSHTLIFDIDLIGCALIN